MQSLCNPSKWIVASHHLVVCQMKCHLVYSIGIDRLEAFVVSVWHPIIRRAFTAAVRSVERWGAKTWALKKEFLRRLTVLEYFFFVLLVYGQIIWSVTFILPFILFSSSLLMKRRFTSFSGRVGSSDDVYTDKTAHPSFPGWGSSQISTHQIARASLRLKVKHSWSPRLWYQFKHNVLGFMIQSWMDELNMYSLGGLRSVLRMLTNRIPSSML